MLGCGDDSKPIAEQWPDYTAGQAGNAQSSFGSTTGDVTNQGASSAGAGQTGGAAPSSSGATDSDTLPGDTHPPGLCTLDRFRCVAPVPAPWQGPVARRLMSSNGVVGHCEGEYRFPINATKPFTGEPVFAPLSCSPCSCGDVQGLSCSDILSVEYHQDSSCGDLLLSVPRVSADNSCIQISSATGQARSVLVPTPILDRAGASCPPNGGFPTKTAATWQRQERWCRARVAQSLRCSDPSRVCVPKVESVFEPGVCIYQEGDHACPSGEYANKVLLYRGEKDQRECSACSCGPVQGELSCGGFLRHYSNDRCYDAPTERVESSRIDTAQSSVCRSLSNFSVAAPRSTLIEPEIQGKEAASCTPSGGQPSGEVVGDDPVTLCCTGS